MNEDALIELKNYFKKLQKIIAKEADFKFFGKSFLKKNKVDDILCCIIATLPSEYKKNMRVASGRKLSSVIAYNALFGAIKKKCPFSSDKYMVDSKKANQLISTIINTIGRDISYIEKNS